MTRLYGWALKGFRCTDHVPCKHWQTYTLISVVRSNHVIDQATLLIDGSMTGECFTGYAKDHLVPSPQQGEIVVMDNLEAHRSPKVRELIAGAGCDLWYLPPYSPDLNPI